MQHAQHVADAQVKEGVFYRSAPRRAGFRGLHQPDSGGDGEEDVQDIRQVGRPRTPLGQHRCEAGADEEA